MQTTKLRIDEIKPYGKNPRTRTAAQIDALKKSLERYGYNVPITVDKDHVIVTGHGRYEAIKAMGWKEIDVVVLDIPVDKARQYRIVDNSVHDITEWNEVGLWQEFKEITDLTYLDELFGNIIEESIEHTETMDHDTDITQDKIDKMDEKRKSAFEDRQQERQGDLIECTCKLCGETFYLSKNEVRRLGTW